MKPSDRTEEKADLAKGIYLHYFDEKMAEYGHRMVRCADDFEFLGWKVQRVGRLIFKPRTKAIQKFKDSVRRYTRRHEGKLVLVVISQLNAVVRGWGHYFAEFLDNPFEGRLLCGSMTCRRESPPAF